MKSNFKKIYTFLNFCPFFLLFFSFFVTSNTFAYEDSIEKRINLWPFLVYSKNKFTKVERLEIAGPFIYKYSFPEEKGLSLRPFYSSIKTSKEKRAYFFSPLGLYKSNNETSTFLFFPFILIKNIWNRDIKKERKHVDFFPFFWGITSENERYGGIFPIYGTFKQRFGAKEITFFLWPFYSKVVYEKYTAKNYFWPFIRIIKPNKPGDKNYKGFKIWPIYGHFKEGRKTRTFVFWPFYIKEVYQGNGYFDKRLIIFPFYIKEDTNLYKTRIIFWPFFQKAYAKDPYYKQIDAPWPFYRKIEGKNIKGFRIWPLYGYVKRNDFLDYFILWPLYFYQEDNIRKNNTLYMEKVYKFLVFSKYKTINKNNAIFINEFRIWPLVYDYTLHSKNEDIKFWYFPAILPIYDEGIKRNYEAFLKLMEYYKKNDYVFFQFLWGLYQFEKYKNRKVQELGFLLRLIKDKETNYIEFLEGLLGFGKIEGKPVCKLFLLTSVQNNFYSLNF